MVYRARGSRRDSGKLLGMTSLRVSAKYALAIGLFSAITACAHTSRAADVASTPTAIVERNPALSPTPAAASKTPDEPCGATPATLSSDQTGRVLLCEISGNAHQCSVTRLYIGLANSSDVSMFVRMMSEGRRVAHVHIDDPTSGHMVYDLDGVTVTGKRLPPSVSQPTFTLRFAAISVTGCGHRQLPAPSDRDGGR